MRNLLIALVLLAGCAHGSLPAPGKVASILRSVCGDAVTVLERMDASPPIEASDASVDSDELPRSP